MKTLFTSDLNVLLQLYAPANYILNIHDPKGKLVEDEPLMGSHGTADTDILLNLSDSAIDSLGERTESFPLILNFGRIKKSAQTERRFSLVNDRENHMRWLFTGKNFRHVLPFYNTSGWRGKLNSLLIKTIDFLGLSSCVRSGKLQVITHSTPKLEDLGQIDHRKTTYSLFLGTRCEQRCALAATFENNGCTEFIKVPVGPKAGQQQDMEKRNLRRLRNFPFQSFQHPTVLPSTDSVLRMKNLDKTSTQKTEEFTPFHLNALLEMNGRDVQGVMLGNSLFMEEIITNLTRMNSSEHKSIKNLKSLLWKELENLDQKTIVYTSFAHRDFTPWNMSIGDQQLNLFDWELASTGTPMFYDFFHFIYQREILMKQNDHSKIRKVVKQEVDQQIELRNLALSLGIDLNRYERLYLLHAASYFGAQLAQGPHSLQHKWQLKTWTEAFESNAGSAVQLATRKEFIQGFNDFLSSRPHAYLKFNAPSLEDLPLSSDIDLCVAKKDLAQIVEFVHKTTIGRVAEKRKSFMSTLEIYFENGDFLSLDLIHQFKRKGLEFMSAVELLNESNDGVQGIQTPSLKHDLEYTYLFYTLNGAHIPEKYYQHFCNRDSKEIEKSIFYLQHKLQIPLTGLASLWSPSLSLSHSTLAGKIARSQNILRRIKNNFYYLLDTLSSSLVSPGFIITFSGVDGAGKSTIIQNLCEELESKYRKEIVLLRHRPGILPMLNAWKVGKKEAERQATINLPRQGKNQSQVASILRFAYYLTDYLLGQIAVQLRYVMRGKVVVYDRYYFDFITDPRRSNLNLPAGLTRFLYRLIIRPKLNFFLYADTEVIRSRKKELDSQTIKELSESYQNLFNELSESERGVRYISIRNHELDQTMRTIITEFTAVA